MWHRGFFSDGRPQKRNCRIRNCKGNRVLVRERIGEFNKLGELWTCPLCHKWFPEEYWGVSQAPLPLDQLGICIEDADDDEEDIGDDE